MTAILITGMSGAGKSTVLRALAERGYETVDTDDEGWIEVVGGEPLWRADRIDELLGRPRRAPLFVQGTVANQGRWYPRFVAVVLLTAPLDVLLGRLATRTGNPFGRSTEHRERVARDTAAVEPLLRSSASHVIDTTAPLEHVVLQLEHLAGTPPTIDQE